MAAVLPSVVTLEGIRTISPLHHCCAKARRVSRLFALLLSVGLLVLSAHVAVALPTSSAQYMLDAAFSSSAVKGESPHFILVGSLSPDWLGAVPASSVSFRLQPGSPLFTENLSRAATPTASPVAAATTPLPVGSSIPTLTPTQTPTASIAVPPSGTPDLYAVSGRIIHGVSGVPVANVAVELQGPTPLTAQTDGEGHYAFVGIPTGSWTIRPNKSGVPAVSALDSVYVLQAVDAGRSLTAAQQLACDVSGNGLLDDDDALLVLRHAVGSIDRFPVSSNCGFDWLFMPVPISVAGQSVTQPRAMAGECAVGMIAFQALNANVQDQNFLAVSLGDCTGNWSPSGR